MIAKLIVWGADRPEALRRLQRALGEYRIVGVATNVEFLRRLVAHDAFVEARVDTDLIAREHAALFPAQAPPSPKILCIAALGECLRLRQAAAARASASCDPYSPWHAIDPWWMNTADHAIELVYAATGANYSVRVHVHGSGERYMVHVDHVAFEATIAEFDGELAITFEGEQLKASVLALADERYVYTDDSTQRLRLVDPLAHAGDEVETGDAHLRAPMSGTVISVLVKLGDTVARGAPLLILEAMKMEHTITAPAAGTVTALHYAQGEQVKEGAEMIDVAATPSPAS